MMAEDPGPDRYALSFTTGALLAREAALLAPVYLERARLGAGPRPSVEGNLLQARTYRTGVRLVRETVKRLSVLTDDEVELLVEATASERGYLMWAAACRRYDLIGEFAEEVVRERFLLLASTLELRGLRQLRPEQGAVARGAGRDQGLDAAEAALERVQDAAGGRAAVGGGHIIPAVLSERVAAVLSARTPSDLRFFPTQQADGQGAAR